MVVLPEHDGGGDECNGVGCCDGYPYSVSAQECAVGSWQFGEYDEEGHEEYQLAADAKEYASLRHSDRLEEVARDNLESDKWRHAYDDAHGNYGDAGEVVVGGEWQYDVFREEFADDEFDAHDCGCHVDGVTQYEVDTVVELCSVVESCDRLHTLTDAEYYHDGEEEYAVDYSIGCDGYVASVGSQSLVDEYDYEAGTELHAER